MVDAEMVVAKSPPLPNVPYSLALFLAPPKKKGEKEGRRSARGRFFRESPQWPKWELGGLRAFTKLPIYGGVRNGTEKPPTPPNTLHLNLQAQPLWLPTWRWRYR